LTGGGLNPSILKVNIPPVAEERRYLIRKVGREAGAQLLIVSLQQPTHDYLALAYLKGFSAKAMKT
jgi:hypothetical protein